MRCHVAGQDPATFLLSFAKNCCNWRRLQEERVAVPVGERQGQGKGKYLPLVELQWGIRVSPPFALTPCVQFVCNFYSALLFPAFLELPLSLSLFLSASLSPFDSSFPYSICSIWFCRCIRFSCSIDCILFQSNAYAEFLHYNKAPLKFYALPPTSVSPLFSPRFSHSAKSSSTPAGYGYCQRL